MALLYCVSKTPDFGKKDENVSLQAKTVTLGTVSTDNLIRQVAEISSFGEGDVRGVLSALFQATSHYLSDSYRVELGDFGVLSPKVSSPQAKTAKEIRSNVVKYSGVKFRASKKLSESIRTKIVRSGFEARQSSDMPEDMRRELLKQHLIKNGYITRPKYSRQTGLLKNKAIADLKKYVTEGWLKTEGKWSHVVYKLRN
jgi:predicted histone-like DNA-binding protein